MFGFRMDWERQERILYFVAGAILVLLVGVIALQVARNPMRASRDALQTAMAKIKPEDMTFEKPKWDFERWQNLIAAKPGLWQELVEPPAPPAPPPERPPDLNAMAKDLAFGRQQIGSKVKLMKPGDPKGSFVTVGDVVNGLTIQEISKTAVTLSLTWKGQELTVSVPRK